MPEGDVQVTLRADASGVTQGVGEAKSAIANFAPQIDALAKSFSGLAGHVKEGFEGVQSLAKGLETATSSGLAGLAGIAEAGAGAAGVIGAVAEAALDATSAMAEWATSTLESNSASAEAKQNAADLNGAIADAGNAFGKVGDSLANAFAPVLTTVINALSGLAKGFKDSYNQGGAAKAIVDTLVVAFKLLAAGVEIAIGAIVAVIQSVRSQIQQWKDEFDTAGTAVAGEVDVLKIRLQTLGQVFKDVFSGDFGKAASDYEAGLAQIDKRTQQTVASIRQQLAKLDADKLAGAKAVLEATSATAADVAHTLSGSPPHDQPSASPPKHDSGAAGGAQRGNASHASTGPNAEACSCDPAATAACETAAQAGATTIATQANQHRVDDHLAANTAMGANDSGATAAFASNQARQVAAAEDADHAKVQSNSAANRQIAEANDRTLKQFEASVKKLANNFADGLAKMAEGSESFGQLMRKIGQQILDDVFRVVAGAVEKWTWGETEKVLASERGQALLQALGLRDLAAAIRNDVAKTTSATTTEHARTAATMSGVAARATAENVGFFAQIITKLASLLGIHVGTEAAKTQVTVGAAAARAGASGVASYAEAPWPIDMGAPAFGASMAAAAQAFGALSSAAGGYDIPAGVNPLTQLHAQEMVLPARLANPMRDMLASFGSGGAPAAAGHTFSFGDTHIHGAPGMSPADFRQALGEHRASVAEAVANALHSGWRPSYRQPVGAL